MTNLEPYRQQMIKRLEAEKVQLQRRLKYTKPQTVEGKYTAGALAQVEGDLLFLDSIGHMVELRGVVS